MFELRLLSRRWMLSSLALFLCSSACGGGEFTSQAGGSGGSAASGTGGGSGGGSNAGAAGASAGAGGRAGNGGSAGNGGAGNSCNCDEGQYCRNGTCRDCDDFSSLEFATPELLEGPSQNDEGSMRFPRSGDSEQSLFYSTGHLYYAPDFASAPGTHISATAAPPEEAPLYIESPGSLNFDLLFTRQVNDVNANRHIVTADWNGSAFTGVTDAPAPVNMDLFDDYSVALATANARFWWMSTRNASPQLLTAVQGDLVAELVEPQVPAGNNIACHAQGEDLTPWVTREGDLLLFSAQVADTQCTVLDDGATDLYAALLDNDGQPAGVGIALSDVNIRDKVSSEVSPSFSPDYCFLYFASDGGEDRGYEFQLYRAARR